MKCGFIYLFIFLTWVSQFQGLLCFDDVVSVLLQSTELPFKNGQRARRTVRSKVALSKKNPTKMEAAACSIYYSKQKITMNMYMYIGAITFNCTQPACQKRKEKKKRKSDKINELMSTCNHQMETKELYSGTSHL